MSSTAFLTRSNGHVELPSLLRQPTPSGHLHTNISSTSLSTQSPRVRIRPLQVQCRSSKVQKHPSICSRFHTWLVCGKDPFDVDWTAPAANLLATVLFIADLVSDFSVAWYHFEEMNYGYAGISFGIFILPILLSIGYYSVYKKYPWYFAHPFEPIYWCKKSYAEYRKVVEQHKQDMSREDAWLHYHSVKNFRTSNWARVSAVRLQVHLAALPQLLFQCYTVNELLHDRELKKISWFSWISIGLSTISLSMYHHTLALAQDKILDKDHDQDNFSRSSPNILFDLIGQGILDCVYIVARAVALSCFFTVHPPWLNGLVFLSLHLTIVYTLTYYAGPKSVNEFKPDFRLILYNRTNHPDILTAAVASLIFPPLMNIEEKDLADTKPRNGLLPYDPEDGLITTNPKCGHVKKLRFVQHWLNARTFWIAAMLLILETETLLLVWVRLNVDHLPGHARTVTMAVVSSAMLAVLIGHVLYVTFICVPIKQRERLVCYRNKGILAKGWLLEVADVHYNYLQDQVMQRLSNIGFTVFTRKTSNIDLANGRQNQSQRPPLWRLGSSADYEADGPLRSTPSPPVRHSLGSLDLETDQLVHDNCRGMLLESHCTLTTEDLQWITETLRTVTDLKDSKDGSDKEVPIGNIYEQALRWQRRQFFRTMILPERILARRIANQTQRQLDEVVRFGVVLDTDEKLPLVQECKRLLTFWMEVVFRCITHQPLPAGLDDMPAHDQAAQMLDWYAQAIRRQPEVEKESGAVDNDHALRRSLEHIYKFRR